MGKSRPPSPKASSDAYDAWFEAWEKSPDLQAGHAPADAAKAAAAFAWQLAGDVQNALVAAHLLRAMAGSLETIHARTRQKRGRGRPAHAARKMSIDLTIAGLSNSGIPPRFIDALLTQTGVAASEEAAKERRKAVWRLVRLGADDHEAEPDEGKKK